MRLKHFFLYNSLIAVCLTACNTTPENEISNTVESIGSLKESIWKRQLYAKIDLDTIPLKHLYGVGPIENLTGDHLILDGVNYAVKSIDDSLIVKKVDGGKLAYFAYQYVPKWVESPITEEIDDLVDLDIFVLSRKELKKNRTTAFKIDGKFKAIEIAVHNLPSKVSFYNYQVALVANTKKQLSDQEGTLIGFFDAERSMQYTHYGEMNVIYFISKDRKTMGRVTQLHFDKKELKFFLPNY